MGVIVAYHKDGANENKKRQDGMIALGNEISKVFSSSTNKATPRKFFKALKDALELKDNQNLKVLDLRYQSASIPQNPVPPARGLKITAVARAGNLIVCRLVNDNNPANPADAGTLLLKFEREDDADQPGGAELPEYFMSVTFPAQADHTGINYFDQVATDIPAIPVEIDVVTGLQTTISRQKYLAAFAFLSRCK